LKKQGFPYSHVIANHPQDGVAIRSFGKVLQWGNGLPRRFAPRNDSVFVALQLPQISSPGKILHLSRQKGDADASPEFAENY
jgi:hypothetical protein